MIRKSFFLAFIAQLILSSVVSSGLPAKIDEIAVPPGCRRLTLPPGSYSQWLRSLPIKSELTILSFAQDTMAHECYRVLAVVDMPLMFSEDLEQCADWCFRFWAEYHREANKLNRLYLFNYQGQRIYFRGSGRSLRSFLRRAMAYGNSFSLKQGCQAVDTSDLRPGDMLVQNLKGGVGHVSMVMDVCQDSLGRKFYLVGYGYMPAQEFHIEEADSSAGRGGWFSLEGYLDYLKKNFPYFGLPVFRRFPEK